jgi:hypothetical protein
MPAPTAGAHPCGHLWRPTAERATCASADRRYPHAQADAPPHRPAEDQSRHGERDTIPTARRSRDRRARWPDRVLSVLSTASASATAVLEALRARRERSRRAGAASPASRPKTTGPRPLDLSRRGFHPRGQRGSLAVNAEPRQVLRTRHDR